MPFCSAYRISRGSVWPEVDIAITIGDDAAEAAKAASKLRLLAATAHEGPSTCVMAAWAAEMNARGWKHLRAAGVWRSGPKCLVWEPPGSVQGVIGSVFRFGQLGGDAAVEAPAQEGWDPGGLRLVTFC